MNTKHTPGPWNWTTASSGPEDEYGCSTRGPVDMGTFKAKGYYDNPELYAANGEQIVSAGSGEYTPVFGATDEERAANARLIAAAPDLLAALEDHAEAVYAILCSDYPKLADGTPDIPARILAAQEHVSAWRAALAKTRA
jgi:hypothetical protein